MKKSKETVKKPNSKKVLSIIAIVLTIVISFTCGYFSKYIFDPKVATSTTDLIKLIQDVGYVLDENGNERKLTKDDYLKAIADGVLDDYSKYYTKEEYEEIEEFACENFEIDKELIDYALGMGEKCDGTCSYEKIEKCLDKRTHYRYNVSCAWTISSAG